MKIVQCDQFISLWRAESLVYHGSRFVTLVETGWDRLRIEDGFLYYQWKGESCSDESKLNLVLQEKYRSVVLQQLHDSRTAAHLGANKVYEKVKARYFWPVCSVVGGHLSTFQRPRKEGLTQR